MSIVSKLTVVPSRLTALLETCRFFGGSVSRSQLAKLMAPASLRSSDLVGDESESAVVTETVDEAVALGLIRLDGPDIQITDLGRGACDDLRGTLLPILTSIARARAAGQKEFPYLLAWLLRSDPSKAEPWDDIPAADMRPLCGADETILKALPRNSQAFQQFHYWARFLGFSVWVPWAGKTGVLSLPVDVVRWAVGIAPIEHSEVMPVGVFVSAVADVCRVLDYGPDREVIELNASTRSYHQGQSVSPALGHALAVLRDAGDLVFEDHDDADRLELVPPGVSGDAWHRVSHVRVAR